MYKGDWEYANSRLAHTVVRHKIEPYHVDHVTPDGMANGYYLKDIRDEPKYINLLLEHLNLEPVTLGYVNYRCQASYTVRVPCRNDWRQGLRRKTLRSLSGLPTQYIHLSSLCHTIKNIYPSFEECLKLFNKEGVKSIAWCRGFAIVPHGALEYKGTSKVGSIVEGKPVLEDNYVHLQEVLEESLCIKC